MKKIISLMLCACMILTSMVAFAAPETKAYESNISVYGKVDATREGDSVSILMYDNDATMDKVDRVLHLGMTEAKVGGYYQYKFKYTMPAGKTLADYTLKAKIGADDITDSIVSVEEDKINAFDVSIRMDAYFTPEVTITNKLESAKGAKVILASYTNDGELVATKIVDTNVPYDKEGKGIVVNVDELGGDYVKAFMWDDNITPLAMTDETNTAVVSKFKDGDVVTFSGSSSMHLSTVPAFVDHFYQTRYPDIDVTISNTGIGGDTVSHVISRYSWDVSYGEPNIIYLICGGNDVNYWEYTADDPYIDAGKINEIEKCLTTYDTFIETMKTNGLDMVLLGCAPYDEVNFSGAITSGENYHPGANAAFRILNTKLDEKVAALENNDGVGRIDFYNYVDQIVADARKDDPTAKALASSDRIHMEKYGYFVQGALILLAQGNDEVVSTVDMNVADVENATIKNATVNVTEATSTKVASVTLTEATSTKVAYEYAPNSIPLGICSWYTDAEKFYPITEKLNQEIIKVAGLEDGTYTITFTGEDDVVYTLGSYTNTELEKGVNIATNEYNPGQIQAKAAMAKQVTRQSQEQSLRTDAYDIRTAGTQTDETTIAGLNAKKDAIQTLSDEAKALSIPKTYTVVIEKQ